MDDDTAAMSMHSFRTANAGVLTLDGERAGDLVAWNRVVADMQHVDVSWRGEAARHEVVGSPVSKDIPLSVIVEHLTRGSAGPVDLTTLNT